MNTEKILEQKIDQILENYKISSKRNASNFLRNNEILINSKKVTSRTEKCNSDFADICVNGKILSKTKNLYIILNKPLGAVCSTKSDSHKTVFDFINEKAAGEDGRQPDETTGETKGEKPSASKEETPSETAAVVPEETTANKVNWKKEIISAIGNTSFRQYSSGIYVLQEDDNYLGEIIVGDKFVQIYVSMRTSGLDSAVKNVISVLLPEEYDNVYSQFSTISKDRTISADGRKITMVAPVNGSHSQLIIYY